jgi:hypothetical protein
MKGEMIMKTEEINEKNAEITEEMLGTDLSKYFYLEKVDDDGETFIKTDFYHFKSKSEKIEIVYLDNCYCFRPSFYEIHTEDTILQEKIKELEQNNNLIYNGYDFADPSNELIKLLVEYESSK